MYALVTAAQFVATGSSRLALAIGADANSRIVDPYDKKTYPLFGDGAGAVLLTKGTDDQGLVAYTMGADGSGEELLCMKAGGSRQSGQRRTVSGAASSLCGWMAGRCSNGRSA